MAEATIAVVAADTVDFGRYPAREKRVAAYTIKNAGDEPLKIISVRKNCGCASASCDKMLLAPEATGTVEVVILPNSILGLYRKNTFVESSDPKNQLLSYPVCFLHMS